MLDSNFSFRLFSENKIKWESKRCNLSFSGRCSLPSHLISENQTKHYYFFVEKINIYIYQLKGATQHFHAEASMNWEMVLVGNRWTLDMNFPALRNYNEASFAGLSWSCFFNPVTKIALKNFKQLPFPFHVRFMFLFGCHTSGMTLRPCFNKSGRITVQNWQICIISNSSWNESPCKWTIYHLQFNFFIQLAFSLTACFSLAEKYPGPLCLH